MDSNSSAIRLIAFDLDGTVLNSKKEVTPRTQAAIEKARAAGIFIVPATGRQYNDIHPLLKKLAFPYIIANNGAQIFSVPRGELIFSRSYDKETVLVLIREFREYDSMIFGAYDMEGVFDSKGRGIETGVAVRKKFITTAGNSYPLADIEELIQRDDKHFLKLVMRFEDMEERKRALERFLPRKDLYVTFFAEDNIEVMPAGINKGLALKVAAEKLGVPMAEVMAIGDSDNDREMIQEAGMGVAMANALDTVKQDARKITLSCDEDGAAAAIESACSNPPHC
jgi:Cof subfamily protein (haloacid dehalogenase superfamily)